MDEPNVKSISREIGVQKLAKELDVTPSAVRACWKPEFQKFPAAWMPKVRSLWKAHGGDWTSAMERELFRWKVA